MIMFILFAIMSNVAAASACSLLLTKMMLRLLSLFATRDGGTDKAMAVIGENNNFQQ